MKIYVVTQGDYSDYHICAVSTDAKGAERLAKIYSTRFSPAEVEEYDTDDSVDLLNGRIPFNVDFHPDGGVLDAYFYEYSFPPADNEIRQYPSGVLRVFVRAEHKTAAIKIAAEKRAKYLAEKNNI